VSRLEGLAGVARVAQGQPAQGEHAHNAAQAGLYLTDARHFLAQPHLREEVFGPASLVVRVANVEEMVALTQQLEGQLTATLQIDEDDHRAAGRLLPTLEKKVGRILANGFPTGVEVCHAMVHGGPFPSTSNAMFTSVGATAIERFLRPVAYQDLPDGLRPAAIQEANPQGLRRRVNGVVEA
jgi:NADP-dependent aldehyde dehydrogenase